MQLTEGKIIYIHPTQYRMFYRCTIPMSLPALIKRIDYPVKGFYPEELTADIIRKAEIAIIDIHWNYALAGAYQLVKDLKELNPEIIVIAGGMTASMYPEQLTQKLDIDYVIRGDGEIPLPALVNAISEKTDMTHIPNVFGKNGLVTEWSYFLTSEELNKNEFYDLRFFPSYQSDIRKIHKRHFGWPNYTFPYLLPFRGCPMPCPSCAGGIGEQKKLFRRGCVVRDAEKLAGDLSLLNSFKDIRFVNVIHDFVSLMPEDYVNTALSTPNRLSLVYEFTTAPPPERLERLFGTFRRGVLYFSIDKMHTQSDHLIDPSVLINLIEKTKKTGRFIPVLYYNSTFKSNPEYVKVLNAVARQTRCLTADVSGWWEDFPRPDENGIASTESFAKFFDLSQKPKLSIFTKLKRWLVFRLYLVFTFILPDILLLKIKSAYVRLFNPYLQ
ncbi:MAG TPA: cobalamin-dependent protein [Bacteroidia bacterium]|nr:cobalamin-dependent protein [Bacteroidia bacterium]HRS58681.1 cobalamin-dependent protein [Bacteroidia bacterium]HRU68304.1 cobalamin-dependent protein [Bacteroidia bacterium]